jgi:hypothetical protein
MCCPGVDGSKNPQHCLSRGTTRILMEEGTLLHNGVGQHSVRSVFFHLLSISFSFFFFLFRIYNILFYVSIYLYIYIIHYTLIRDASVHVYIIICSRICIMYVHVPWPLETPLSSGTAVNLDGISVLRTTSSVGVPNKHANGLCVFIDIVVIFLKKNYYYYYIVLFDFNAIIVT